MFLVEIFKVLRNFSHALLMSTNYLIFLNLQTFLKIKPDLFR